MDARNAPPSPTHARERGTTLVYGLLLLTWCLEGILFLTRPTGPLLSDAASYWAAGAQILRTHVLLNYWPPGYPQGNVKVGGADGRPAEGTSEGERSRGRVAGTMGALTRLVGWRWWGCVPPDSVGGQAKAGGAVVAGWGCARLWSAALDAQDGTNGFGMAAQVTKGGRDVGDGKTMQETDRAVAQ